MEGKTEAILLFLDLKDAYGSVIIKKMLEIMTNLKIWAETEILIILFLWANQWLRLGKRKTRVNVGLPQGSPLSCQLFGFYIGDMMMTLRARLKEIGLQ